jgi:hypothetical protein
MTPHPLELYRVSGSHREVGIQMGELGAEQILSLIHINEPTRH